jgi:hypothetical protein
LKGRDRKVDEGIIRKYIIKEDEISKMESVECGLVVVIRLL